ncbi:MAG: dihydrolipoyl dehydrogenase [Muribaculaceae bacterium]|nr:dihydrolipoyl dehydrogenase [Muribaculaceae bacterium]
MTETDIIIIGAGPGGMDTAASACAMGKSVVVIEKGRIGGTCLNRGCIPTKALARTAQIALDAREAEVFGIGIDGVKVDFRRVMERKDEVVTALREGAAMGLKGVRVVEGVAEFTGTHTVTAAGEEFTAPTIVIATGSEPAKIPIPGAEYAIDSDSFLETTVLPGRVTIVGGGVIGIEFASILNAFGCDVTVVEFCKEILPPFDKDIAKRLRMSLGKRGVKIITSAAVTEIKENRTVIYECKGKTIEVESDVVIMAVGRRAVLPAGLDKAGIETDRRGIVVNENYETTAPGVYAIGDVNAKCMLAHAAVAQGRRVLGEDVDMNVIPAAVFSVPECSMVGMTEEQCKEHEVEYKSVKVPFRGNGKAVAMGEADGLLKLLVDNTSGKILGVHICGPHAADLISEPALAMANEMTVEAISRTIHAHPTLGELLATAVTR